ncbi:hypothetical protein F7734_56200 [Scytonema sp. UIC 10036]|uniref:hypothetical protein n=1 Tax=Scytonema sp. UIC 10036 TaxID=2304196 RepID=UPI0012DA9C21|nr:hypothetical protein [Scytonema sp. UIC 10036]MUH01120.1 hypothetical protein [Scytonema sp. UIC 10036]
MNGFWLSAVIRTIRTFPHRLRMYRLADFAEVRIDLPTLYKGEKLCKIRNRA